MFLKIVSPLLPGEESPNFTLIECSSVSFSRPQEQPISADYPEAQPVVHVDGIRRYLHGNAYVLNNAGKTIDSYHFSSKDS